MDPKKLNSYVGVVNQPPPKWSSVKKWLLHINYAPGYAPEPEQKPVCRQFSRCEGCPYPAHGFLCWGGEDDCMRTRVKKLNEKELEHEDQSGFVYSDLDTEETLGEEMVPDPNAESVEDKAVGNILLQELRQCLAQLPLEEQNLIRALYFEELTEREYAKQINISQKAVNKRRHKILSKLRALMKIK